MKLNHREREREREQVIYLDEYFSDVSLISKLFYQVLINRNLYIWE
jgi:hypothetical protein